MKHTSLLISVLIASMLCGNVHADKLDRELADRAARGVPPPKDKPSTKRSLPYDIASGQTVRCADQSRGKWCDATNNPSPAWDGTPVGGHPVPQAQRTAKSCSGLSGKQQVACEQATTIVPALGNILGR